MAFLLSSGIGIAGIACAVPDNEVPVESFYEVFGPVIPEKFAELTGIRCSFKALPEQTASDLAYAAASHLLEKMNIGREKIGGLIFITQSPDYRRPASACVLQHRLELPMDCMAMDIGLGCSGFVYGLQTAMSLMEHSDMEYCLLLLGETASKVVDPLDKSVVMMYGDAGAAVLLKHDETAKTPALLKTDGSRFRNIILPAGGFRDMDPPRERFLCNDGIERTLYDIYMEGTSVFSFSISDVPKTILEFLERTKTGTDDYDLFVFHQANRFIIKQLSKKLKISAEKVPISLDRYGNSGGISIPLTLCHRFGGTDEGVKNTLMAGFGIGLSWGVTSAKIDTEKLFPVIRTKDWYREGKITPEMLM